MTRTALMPAIALILAIPLAAVPLVVVTERPTTDTWSVTWQFDDDVSGISFQRGREPFRASEWRIVRPADARWTVVDGRDAILLERPARRIAVELASDFRHRQKDYEINIAFTDGSRLLYTGHFAVDPLEPCEECDGRAKIAGADDRRMTWRFGTAADRTIRLLEKSHIRTLDWSPRPGRESEDGTYVYFGSIEPVPAGKFTLLVDPGMPNWLVKRIRAEFPRMFEFHARLTGIELDFVPLVLLSYRPSESAGFSFSGGTLDGLVQISAEGKAWETESPEAARLWFRHLAHEAFHFWDGQMFVADEESEWLSEAAAEYASFLAMRDRGLIDDAELDRALVEQCNDCLVRAEGMSIAEAPSKGNFSIVYSCGLVTQLLADRGIARSKPGSGIEVLYRKLFDAGGSRRYGAGDFVKLVASLAGRGAAADVEVLVHDGVARDFDLYLVEALRRNGLEVSLGSAAEAAVTQGTARDEARAILRRCACATGEAVLCEDPALVACVEGWSVRSAPERIVDGLNAAMRENASAGIRIRGTTDGRELRCANAPSTHRSLLVLD